MAVAFVLDFVDASLGDYDAVMEKMQLEGMLPKGSRLHAAGAVEDGIRIVDVWESDEAFTEHAAEKIAPLTAAQGMSEPKTERLEIDQLLQGEGAGVGFVQLVRLKGTDGDAFRALDADMPAGLVWHVNGPADDGWLVIDGWTSKEARDAFMEGSVEPAARSELDVPPIVEELPVHNSLTLPASVAS